MINLKKHWHIKEIGKWGLVVSIWFPLGKYSRTPLCSKHLIRDGDAVGEGVVIGIHHRVEPDYPQYIMIEFLISPSIPLWVT